MMARERTTWMKIAPHLIHPRMPDAHDTENIPQSAGDGGCSHGKRYPEF